MLGTGTISTRFATALRDVPGAKLVAVGSRTVARAAQFGAEFGVAPDGHCDYAGAVSHPGVAFVYVGTPHQCHAADALAAIAAGAHACLHGCLSVRSRMCACCVGVKRGGQVPLCVCSTGCLRSWRVRAGKHVLCEKPFTVNAKEAEAVVAAAAARGVLVCEAMWTRFIPAYRCGG